MKDEKQIRKRLNFLYNREERKNISSNELERILIEINLLHWVLGEEL